MIAGESGVWDEGEENERERVLFKGMLSTHSFTSHTSLVKFYLLIFFNSSDSYMRSKKRYVDISPIIYRL